MNTTQYVNTITSQAMRITELEDQVSALRRELANVKEAEPEPEPVAEPAPVAEPEPVAVPAPVAEPEPVAMVRFAVGDEQTTHGMCGKVTHRIVKRTAKCVYIETTENGKTYKPRRKAIGEDIAHSYEYTKHGKYIECIATDFKTQPTPKPTPAPSATAQPLNPARYFNVGDCYGVKVGGEWERVQVVKRVGFVITCKWLSYNQTFTKKATHSPLTGESFHYMGLFIEASNWGC